MGNMHLHETLRPVGECHRCDLNRDEIADQQKDYPYLITDRDGGVLARFDEEQERDEALLTGDYPDDAEPAFLNV